jgi:hypothetical protein
MANVSLQFGAAPTVARWPELAASRLLDAAAGWTRRQSPVFSQVSPESGVYLHFGAMLRFAESAEE